MPKPGAAYSLALVLALAFAAGCGGGGGGKSTATPTVEVTKTIASTGTPTQSATAAPDIRLQAWSQQTAIRDFLSTAGGQVDTNAIIYADLTKDGVDDAVVPISSGGEGGDIAVFVFAYGRDGLRELVREVPPTPPVVATVEQGRLRLAEAVYVPGDPRCCPSEIHTTTFGWNGSQLIAVSQSVTRVPTQ